MKHILFILLIMFSSALFPAAGMTAPLRILALTPHACEMLYAIGAGAQIVGAVSYCDYPKEAESIPRVGSYVRINSESALRLKPDVAIVREQNVVGIEALKKMGVKIIVSNPVSFEKIFDDIRLLGEITGHKTEAEALTQQLNDRLQRVRDKKRSESAVFYEVWHDPIITAGGPSFINDLIHEAGGRNVFADIQIETPHVNVESVVRAKPSLIVIPLEKRNIEERQLFWEKWLGQGGVRFVSIDPDLLHRPGPRLLDGLELLQQALQSQNHLATDGPGHTLSRKLDSPREHR